MKKLILSLSAVGLFAFCVGFASANRPTTDKTVNTTKTTTEETKNTEPAEVPLDQFIRSTYHHIDFGAEPVSQDAFTAAFHGYLNLRAQGKVNPDKAILSIVDFTRPSYERRLWIIDLNQRKTLIHDYVAHGQGSGATYAKSFSNTPNSHMSSIGFYVTANTYYGKHGLSLRMHGMDKGFNSAAFDRAIVVHGADYVSEDFIGRQHRLGRSWGCPAVKSELAPQVINTIKDGTVLFIYYPQEKYLTSSRWLKEGVPTITNEMSAGMIALTRPTDSLN